MRGEMIKIKADSDGAFGGYLALPDSGSGAAIVVIQEIFGVNSGMRSICDDLAADGYVALCPDLFWRQAPGIQLSDQTDEEMEKAFALYAGFDVDTGIRDIASTIECLRTMPEAMGPVGAVGYCLGGLLAYLTAARTSVDAAVSFYGVGVETKLGESSNITSPLLMHIAEEDGFVDKAAQEKIHTALGLHSSVTLYSYPGVDHAFARPDGIHHDVAAAAVANERTSAFFKEHLG